MAGATVDERLFGLARDAQRLALAAETATPPRPAEAAAQYRVAALIWQHFRTTTRRAHNEPCTGAHRAAAAAAAAAVELTAAKAENLAALAAAESDQVDFF